MNNRVLRPFSPAWWQFHRTAKTNTDNNVIAPDGGEGGSVEIVEDDIDETKTYEKDEMVVINDRFFVANDEIPPGTDFILGEAGATWREISQTVVLEYIPGQNYPEGSPVISGGALLVANTDITKAPDPLDVSDWESLSSRPLAFINGARGINGEDSFVGRPVSTNGRPMGGTSVGTTDTQVAVEFVWDRFQGLNDVPRVNGNLLTNIVGDAAISPTFVGEAILPVGTHELTYGSLTQEFDVVTAVRPVITAASLTAPIYPGTQTAIRDGQSTGFTFTTDTDVVEWQTIGAGGLVASSGNLNGTTGAGIFLAGATDGTTFPRFRVRNAQGVWSTEHAINTALIVDNAEPLVELQSIAYPPAQRALKGSEQATVNVRNTRVTAVSYTSPGGELTIAGQNTVATSKTVTRIGGGYNVDTDNLQVVATNGANGLSRTFTFQVGIANTPAVVTATAGDVISGGNDGTDVQEHVFLLSSDQEFNGTPSVNIAAGTWIGAGWAQVDLSTASRTIGISDTDARGDHLLSGLQSFNEARVPTTVLQNATYTIAGFVERIMTLEPNVSRTTINVPIHELDTMVVFWDVNASELTRVAADTEDDVASSYFAEDNGDGTSTIRILDKSLLGTTSANHFLTISETI